MADSENAKTTKNARLWAFIGIAIVLVGIIVTVYLLQQRQTFLSQAEEQTGDYGCILKCVLNQPVVGLVRCEATLTTNEPFVQNCATTWDGGPTSGSPPGSCKITEPICLGVAGETSSETHTASITLGRVETKTNEPAKWVTCSDTFSVDCEGDASSTPTPTPPPGGLLIDLNGDGVVDIADFSVLLGNYGQSGQNLLGDLNGDGNVDILDLSIFIDEYQTYIQ